MIALFGKGYYVNSTSSTLDLARNRISSFRKDIDSFTIHSATDDKENCLLTEIGVASTRKDEVKLKQLLDEYEKTH